MMQKAFPALADPGLKSLKALPESAESTQELIRACYCGILGREPDAAGLKDYVQRLEQGESVESILRRFVASKEFFAKFITKGEINSPVDNTKFPLDYNPPGSAGRSYRSRRASGFFAKYLSGEKILDIGYKGYANPQLRTVVPHAIGVDLDFPGYDGLHLPFEDSSVDCVFSSHCLEHITSYKEAICDWYRVTKLGGFIVCIVPSQLLYEKRRDLPSKFNHDHKRFYSPSSLLGEFEHSLEENSYRIRYLEENDRGYDYKIGPERHATGCYEIVLVVEKIQRPNWRLSRRVTAR